MRCPKCAEYVRGIRGKRTLELHGKCYYCQMGFDEVKRNKFRNSRR